MRLIFSFLLSFTCFSGLVAQQQYLFSHINTHNGLGSQTANSVVQDDKGFIWIGTNNGLQRYDNKSFVNFYHRDGDSTSLTSNRVTWIRKDTQNRLWMLLEDSKIGYFNPSTFKFHEVSIDASVSDLHIRDGRLYTDSLGHIIFLLNGKSFYTYDEKQDKFLAAANPFSIPAKWEPYWLYYDHDHSSYWIGCDSGLVKYNIKTKTLSYGNHNTDRDPIIDSLGGIKVILQPLYDKYGKFWIVSWYDGSIHIISYDTKTRIKKDWGNILLSMNKGWYYEVTSLMQQSNGSLWISGPNMFAHFLNSTNNFEFIRNDQPGEFSIIYDGVNYTYEDREKNLWVCTNKGLYRFNPEAQLFHTYYNKPYYKDTTFFADVSDFIQLSNKHFIVATWGNGLLSYDSSFKPIRENFIEQGIKLAEGMDWCIIQRKNGDIWRGHQGGIIYIYHAATNTSDTLRPQILNHSTVRQITEDSNGNLWLGMPSGLIAEWIASTNTFKFIQKFSSTIHRIYIDKRNTVWVCLRSDGIVHLNSVDGSIIRHYTTNDIAGKKLMIAAGNDIIQYNDSLYFIASGSINVLNIRNDSIRFMNPKNAELSNTISNLVLDRSGTLWISAENGIFSMNMKTEVVTFYDENDGLLPDAINFASSYTFPDGRIAFGRQHDFVIFNPNEVKAASTSSPPVIITGFKLMDDALLTDSLLSQRSIEFPYNKNAVTIQFSTLAYQNNYALFYQLEGLDKTWIEASSNQVVYNYLPPGKYTFRAYAENPDGIKSRQITELTFTIATPFWQTWWFYCLLALLAVALLYWFDMERMKRKAAFQKIRTNISDNLHTEVNNALQDINILSEIATIKADADPVQSKNYISEINYKSRNMISSMDDMLWSINPLNDTMEKFFKRAKEFAAGMSTDKNIIINIQADRSSLLLKPDMKLRHELMLIYKTSVNWLVNEMQSNNTQVQLNYINRQLQLNMFATGIRHLTNEYTALEKQLEKRADSINASVDILNEEKGIAIIVTLKI